MKTFAGKVLGDKWGDVLIEKIAILYPLSRVKFFNAITILFYLYRNIKTPYVNYT